MGYSLAKTDDENKVIDAGEENGVKIKDLRVGMLVRIAGRVYRVMADGVKGMRLCFVPEGNQ